MNIKISDLLFEENNSDSIHEVFEKNNAKAVLKSNKRKRSKLIYEQDEQNLNKQQLTKLSKIVSPKIASKYDSPEELKKMIDDQGIGDSKAGVPESSITKSYNIQKIITSGEVDIKEFIWKIDKAILYENNTKKDLENFDLITNFNLEKIKNLFENLESLTIFELHKLDQTI